MAVLAIGLIGAGIGGAIGASVPAIGAGLGIGLGWSAFSMIGQIVFPPSFPDMHTVNEGARLDTLLVQASAYGRVLPKIYGCARVAGNIIWASELRETRHVERQTYEAGGKGGGGSTQTVENVYYTYALDAAIAICEGPIFGIRRIWTNTDLIYSKHVDADDDTDTISEAFAESLTIYTGTDDQEPDSLMEAALGAGNVPAYRGVAYVVLENFDVTKTAGRLPNFTFEVVTNGHYYGESDLIVVDDVALADIISDLIVGYTNLTAEDIDVTDVDQMIKGYLINQQCNVRAALEPLLLAYFIDTVESAGKLKFVSRGNTSAETINRDNLLPLQGNENVVDLAVIERSSEQEIPRKVIVTALNYDKDCETTSQYFNRQFTLSKKESTQTLSLVLTPAEAAQIAEVLLMVAWMQRSSVRFGLDYSYLKYEPTDVITIQTETQAYTIRIIKKDITENQLQLEGVFEDIEIYNPVSEGSGADEGTYKIALPSVTNLYLMDLPLLHDNDANCGFYLAATGAEPWYGCTVIVSPEEDGIYYTFENITAYAVAGETTTALSSDAQTTVITDEYVDVQLIRGELESITKEELLDGGNLCVIGDEIIQFQTKQLLGTLKYRLSGLLRARFGTEWAMANHAVGDKFVLLDGAVKRIERPYNDIGKTRWFKAQSITALTNPEIKFFGQFMPTYGPISDPQSFTLTGESLKPLSPVHISGERDADGNLYISWIRRVRKDGQWRDLVDAPNSEPTLEFEVDIMDGETIKRVIWVTDSTYTEYTADQQIEDFGSVQASVAVNVYQYSSYVHLGHVGSATI